MNGHLEDLKPLLHKLNHWVAWTLAVWFSGSIVLGLLGKNHEVISVVILAVMIFLLLPSTRKSIFKKLENSEIPSAPSSSDAIQDNPKLTHCTACNDVMAKDAPKCPHCGHLNTAKMKTAALITLFLIFGLPASCAIAISSIEPTPITNETDLSRYAHLHCEKAVKELLRAPASAEGTGEFQWTKAPDKQFYTIKLSMDAQNAFGALLRSNWFCQIEYVSGNQIDRSSWKVTDLVRN